MVHFVEDGSSLSRGRYGVILFCVIVLWYIGDIRTIRFIITLTVLKIELLMCFGEKSLRGSKSGAIWSRTAWGSPGHPGFGQMLIFLVKTHEHNQFFIINCFGHKKITNTIDMAKTKVLDQ